jgi:hypothetical protein
VGVELDADTDAPELADVPLDEAELDVVEDAWVVPMAAAAVVAVAWWVRLIAASVAPNRRAAVASSAAAVRRGERPGRTRRFGTRALRMEIAPGHRWWMRLVCDRRICPA